jgi:hypothetical protein
MKFTLQVKMWDGWRDRKTFKSLKSASQACVQLKKQNTLDKSILTRVLDESGRKVFPVKTT